SSPSGDASTIATVNATRAAPGTSSRSSSNRFATSSPAKKLTPVRLPSGRARLATRPSRTGPVRIVVPFAASGPVCYCLRPIAFGGNEHGIEWHRINRAFGRRGVQDDGWHQYVARAVSWGGTGAN